MAESNPADFHSAFERLAADFDGLAQEVECDSGGVVKQAEEKDVPEPTFVASGNWLANAGEQLLSQKRKLDQARAARACRGLMHEAGLLILDFYSVYNPSIDGLSELVAVHDLNEWGGIATNPSNLFALFAGGPRFELIDDQGRSGEYRKPNCGWPIEFTPADLSPSLEAQRQQNGWTQPDADQCRRYADACRSLARNALETQLARQPSASTIRRRIAGRLGPGAPVGYAFAPAAPTQTHAGIALNPDPASRMADGEHGNTRPQHQTSVIDATFQADGDPEEVHGEARAEAVPAPEAAEVIVGYGDDCCMLSENGAIVSLTHEETKIFLRFALKIEKQNPSEIVPWEDVNEAAGFEPVQKQSPNVAKLLSDLNKKLRRWRRTPDREDWIETKKGKNGGRFLNASIKWKVDCDNRFLKEWVKPSLSIPGPTINPHTAARNTPNKGEKLPAKSRQATRSDGEDDEAS